MTTTLDVVDVWIFRPASSSFDDISEKLLREESLKNFEEKLHIIIFSAAANFASIFVYWRFYGDPPRRFFGSRRRQFFAVVVVRRFVI
uniref:Uncharacterized protein n=1 Tax=Romanomermis culicivorax TaxID=13658 RepID=A0A915JDV5_ROMCU